MLASDIRHFSQFFFIFNQLCLCVNHLGVSTVESAYFYDVNQTGDQLCRVNVTFFRMASTASLSIQSG